MLALIAASIAAIAGRMRTGRAGFGCTGAEWIAGGVVRVSGFATAIRTSDDGEQTLAAMMDAGKARGSVEHRGASSMENVFFAWRGAGRCIGTSFSDGGLILSLS